LEKYAEYGAVALAVVIVRELCAVTLAAIRGWAARDNTTQNDQVSQAIIRTAQHTEALTRLLEGLVRETQENAKILARVEVKLETSASQWRGSSPAVVVSRRRKLRRVPLGIPRTRSISRRNASAAVRFAGSPDVNDSLACSVDQK
jgi:hypothetical protein